MLSFSHGSSSVGGTTGSSELSGQQVKDLAQLTHETDLPMCKSMIPIDKRICKICNLKVRLVRRNHSQNISLSLSKERTFAWHSLRAASETEADRLAFGQSKRRSSPANLGVGKSVDAS